MKFWFKNLLKQKECCTLRKIDKMVTKIDSGVVKIIHYIHKVNNNKLKKCIFGVEKVLSLFWYSSWCKNIFKYLLILEIVNEISKFANNIYNNKINLVCFKEIFMLFFIGMFNLVPFILINFLFSPLGIGSVESYAFDGNAHSNRGTI